MIPILYLESKKNRISLTNTIARQINLYIIQQLLFSILTVVRNILQLIGRRFGKNQHSNESKIFKLFIEINTNIQICIINLRLIIKKPKIQINLILSFVIWENIFGYKVKTNTTTILLEIRTTLGNCLYYNSSIKKYKGNDSRNCY